jgi:hypothetical protein
MANASKKHFGAGTQGKGDGSGANTELPRELVGENDILSNRDKSQHGEERGLDSKHVQNEQRRDHAANQYREASASSVEETQITADEGGATSQSTDTLYSGHPEFSQDAASNKPPDGIGNSEPVDDSDERIRRSEGVNLARPAPQPTSGAAQALARHSKDS